MKNLSHEVRRHSTVIAREIIEDSPLLVVQGARQVGKSTLLRQTFSNDEAAFVTLDVDVEREYAQADPIGFLQQAPNKTLVIDEAQRAPHLALALKRVIDLDRRPGRYAITGSTDLLTLPGVSDSLAGRAESLRLYGLSQGELANRSTPEDWVHWILSVTSSTTIDSVGEHYQHENIARPEQQRSIVIAGGYPEPLKREPGRRRDRWFSSYLERLATHDARELAGSSDYAEYLQPLLKILASQGQAELVKAKVARNLGISETALTDYLQLAERMYLVDSIPGWGVGFTNRSVKRPKISVSDTGLAAFLSGLTVQKSLQSGGFELYGALLEAFIVGELRKQQTWSTERYSIAHFRQRNEEIDIVVELADGRVILIEVKSSHDVDARAWKHLKTIGSQLGQRVAATVVIYLGDKALRFHDDGHTIFVLPVTSLWQHPEPRQG